MTTVTPITKKDRDKMRGDRIKKIRTELKLTQIDFGKLMSNNDYIDRKTVYGWEAGRFCPNEKILKKIAQFGRTTEEVVLYGTIEDYINGLILNKDCLIGNPFIPVDADLFYYLRFTDKQTTVQVFQGLDSPQKEHISSLTIKKIKKKSIKIQDYENIAKTFCEVLQDSTQGDIKWITHALTQSIHIIESEWLPDQLEDNYYNEDNSYPPGAIDMLQNAIGDFKSEIKKIEESYSKFNNRDNTGI